MHHLGGRLRIRTSTFNVCVNWEGTTSEWSKEEQVDITFDVLL